MSENNPNAISWPQKENFRWDRIRSPHMEEGTALFSQSNSLKSHKRVHSPNTSESLNALHDPRTSLTSQIVDSLHQDVIKQFQFFNNFNKSLKIAIFDEFLVFATSSEHYFPEIDSYLVFSEYINNRYNKYRQEIHQFIDQYCYRVAIIYLLKIRFMAAFAVCKRGTLTLRDLLNPGRFLADIFQNGMLRELQTDALKSNHYSWYRPTEHQLPCLTKMLSYLPKVNLTEIMNAIERGTDYGKLTSKISHSLNYKHYGQFLKTLLLEFPNWRYEINKESSENLYPSLFGDYNEKLSSMISCKISGDAITTMASSYWPSEDYAESFKKERPEILYPEFIKDEKSKDIYFKLTQELQFLTQFVENIKGSENISLNHLYDILRQRGEDKRNTLGEQLSMFPECQSENILRYDRIILNLLHFPKNNPHFFLVNKVLSQQDFLNDNGLIYILSSKKLFVPSQRDKVEQLLDVFKLEGTFTFRDIKGPEEIAPYIYIFSKKEIADTHPGSSGVIRPFAQSKKRPCLSFRFSGEIASLNQFFGINHALQIFFQTRPADTTPIYQAELEGNLAFEFYQDAILDGRLINSSSKDASHITHPSFFKHLVKSCFTLDKFFHVNTIRTSTDEKQSPLRDMMDNPLGLLFNQEDNYTYILIIDFRNAEYPQIEIITPEMYKAKLQEYGIAFCHYFGLIPKIPNCNINIFREFFNTNLGQQIIQLSLTGYLSKLKAKVSSLLVPKFFATTQDLPDYMKGRFDCLSLSPKQIINMRPQELQMQLDDLIPELHEKSKTHPWCITGLLSYFKHNVEKSISYFRETNPRQSTIDYTNPFIIDALINAPSFNLHPHNQEYFIEFSTRSQAELNAPLSKVLPYLDGVDGPYLELFSHQKIILKIYSDADALHFLKFLLESAINVPITHILKHLKIPSIATLKTIISNFQNQKILLKNLQGKSMTLIEQIFKNQIIQQE